MVKEIELKVPHKIEDFRIHHLAAITDRDFFNTDKPTHQRIVSFMAKVTGESELLMRRCDIYDLIKLYNKVVMGMQDIEKRMSIRGYRKPPQEIEVNGKKYEFVNLSRPSVGFIIDVNNSDFEKDPVRMACMSYIPKGSKYGDIDDSENLLHPISERYDDFKSHFPLDVYLDLQGFFLKRYVKLARIYMVSLKIQQWLKRVLTIGWMRSILLPKSTNSNGTK